jgi:hypothetical protein
MMRIEGDLLACGEGWETSGRVWPFHVIHKI